MINLHRSFIYSISIILLLLSMPLLSQMPDWRFFKDRDGNKYYLDRTGKIYVLDLPLDKHIIITPNSLDYSIRSAQELIKQGRIEPALRILKGIKSLIAANMRIRRAQIKATQLIHNLHSKHGTRYKDFNRRASLILYKQRNQLTVINEGMRYIQTLPDGSNLIRERKRSSHGYTYTGLRFGINTSKPEEKSNRKSNKRYFDAFLSIDSEYYRSNFNSVENGEKHWRTVLGHDELRRKLLYTTDSKKFYEFAHIQTGTAGYEVILINGNYIHILRIISSKEYFGENKKILRGIADKLKVVSAN